MTKQQVLDSGYVELVESWGSDERIVEAARMSTAKGFLGWGPKCSNCDLRRNRIISESFASKSKPCPGCGARCKTTPGDEKLLKHLWKNRHATPFEMAGMIIEVKAPIMVFREWHRHRTQSYNEMSARYVPLPDENYTPSLQRVMNGANTKTTNKQAQNVNGKVLSEPDALDWLASLVAVYEHAQRVYERGLELGVPKELARLPVPVARYSVMRASANLRNWIGFLQLRKHKAAQWEIRQYADVVAQLIAREFNRVHKVACSSYKG